MKRFLLFITILLALASSGHAVSVAPTYVGAAPTDSVYVTFTVMDTTYYPTLTAPDSVNVLKVRPNGTHSDSILIGSAQLLQIKPGCYRAALRGSDASGTLGKYTVYVMVRVGGAWRGAASAAYQVGGVILASGSITNTTYAAGAISSSVIANLSLDSTKFSAAFWNALPKQVWKNYSRRLSNFDEDNFAADSLDVNGTTIGTAINLTNNNDKTGYSISGTKQTLDALVDLSAGAVYTYFTSGANEDPFKATVSNLALEASVTKVRDSVSLASIWSEAEKDSVLAQTFGIALYWGAMNGYRMINFPGTTTYVDSMWHVKSGVSPDSVKATTYVTFNAQYVAGSRFIIW